MPIYVNYENFSAMGAEAFGTRLMYNLESQLNADEQTAREIADQARRTGTELFNQEPFENSLGEYLANHFTSEGWIVVRMKMLNGHDLRGRWNQLVVMYEFGRFVGDFDPRFKDAEPCPPFELDELAQSIDEGNPGIGFRTEGTE